MTDNPFINTTSGLQPNAGVVGDPGAITATSTTSQTIGTGVLSFQVPTQAAWAPGMFISIVDANNPANYMTGVVQSYLTSTLVVDVTNSGGSGLKDSWLINLAGSPGPAGTTGAAGANGTNGANGGPVNGSTKGLKIINNAGTPSTKVDITAAAAAMVTSGGTSIRDTSVSVTVDLTTGTSSADANGMDGEARGTSAWLYLYLISNGSITAGLATTTSPLAGAPTLPAGYTYSAYVGAMYVDGSGNLMRTQQQKNRAHYVVTAATNTAALPTLGNGAAGTPGTPTWASIALAAFVPPTASDILLAANCDVGGTPTTVIAAPNNAYGTATSTKPPPVIATTSVNSAISVMPIESSNIYWASGGTDGYLFCLGWNDYVASA